MAETKLCSLNEIFNERFFRIPDFQRGYSWENSQLEDFWNDLINLKAGKSHYTGLLTIEPILRENIEGSDKWKDDLWLFERNFKAYYLIDGQQRLTTSIILINEILSFIKDGDDIFFNSKDYWVNKFLYQSYKNEYKSYVFGYEKDNPSDEFFKTKILKQKSSGADKYPENTLYTMNLENAKLFFKEKLSHLKMEDIESIFKKLVSYLKFNLYEINDELNVYVTFETMNNRGKKLSTLELLKNRLIYLTTLLDDKGKEDRLRKDINESWKTIYEFLGKNKDKLLNDDDFLQDHWIMYFTYNRKESSSYAKFLLHEHFTNHSLIEQKIEFIDIKNYVSSLQESIKSWFYLYNPDFSIYSNEIKQWLYKLNRLSMRAFSPLLISVMNKFHNNEITEIDLLNTLKVSERFIFLIFMISQRRSDTQNSVLYKYANELHKGEKTIGEVVDAISYLIDGGYYDEQGEYHYDGWLSIDRFISYIKEQYDKKEGFYSWNGLRYFLYEYELSLQKKAKGEEKVSWSEINKRDTIEHVYPQTAKSKYWKDNVEKFAKRPKDKTRLLHSLGNLVLLSRSKNAELQNNDFDFKKKHIDNKSGDEVGFYNGSYSEIDIANYQKWDAKAILKRGIEMLEFMDLRWNIRFDDWEDAEFIKILELEFLEDKK